jgi:hypothetical protein
MKKWKLLMIGLFLSLMITGCSNVDTVKDGTLNFDNSITVGEAFDKYSYFSDTEWTDFETSNGRRIVQVTGIFNDDYIKKMGWTKQFSEVSLIVQFKINKDDTFEIVAIGLETTNLKGKTKKVDLGKGMSTRQLNMMLKELYNDRPLS